MRHTPTRRLAPGLRPSRPGGIRSAVAVPVLVLALLSPSALPGQSPDGTRIGYIASLHGIWTTADGDTVGPGRILRARDTLLAEAPLAKAELAAILMDGRRIWWSCARDDCRQGLVPADSVRRRPSGPHLGRIVSAVAELWKERGRDEVSLIARGAGDLAVHEAVVRCGPEGADLSSALLDLPPGDYRMHIRLLSATPDRIEVDARVLERVVALPEEPSPGPLVPLPGPDLYTVHVALLADPGVQGDAWVLCLDGLQGDDAIDAASDPGRVSFEEAVRRFDEATAAAKGWGGDPEASRDAATFLRTALLVLWRDGAP